MALRLCDVTRLDSLFDVSHRFDVERGVRQSSVHHRQTEDGEEGVDAGYQDEIPVVRCAFAQSITQYNAGGLNRSRKGWEGIGHLFSGLATIAAEIF